MSDEKKAVVYDIDGYDIITSALLDLLNQFPGLADGDEIAFATLGAENGKAIFPANGAVVETEKISVTGIVRQTCAYPFHLVYRASGLSESRKAKAKEWLDGLGRWLEGQPVTINGETYELDRYPALTGSRQFKSIRRSSPAYLSETEENKAENWVIYLTARYENIFKRK